MKWHCMEPILFYFQTIEWKLLSIPFFNIQVILYNAYFLYEDVHFEAGNVWTLGKLCKMNIALTTTSK